jgi:hypothetical protein
MAASGSNISVSTGPRLFTYKMILKNEKNFGGQISCERYVKSILFGTEPGINLVK